MLSIDDIGLLSNQRAISGGSGDTLTRHIKYGELVESLDIIVTSKPGYKAEKLSDKVTVYPTNTRGMSGHLRAVLGYTKNIIGGRGIDLVVAQDLTAPAARLIKKIYQVPYMVTFHGADWSSPEWHIKLTDKLLMPAIKHAVKQADGLRVVSQAMKDYFIKWGVVSSIEVIPTPIDLGIFAQQQTDQVQNIKNQYPNQKIILTVGRLEPVKNYPLLFKALRTLVISHKLSVICLIISTGSQEEKLKKLAKEMQLADSLEFLGSKPYSEMPAYFQTCDVFVLTSFSESLGQVLLQAGAAGKPVVTTKTLGAQGIVKNEETGYLVDIGDADTLTDKINLLLTDEYLAATMGAKAREHVLANYNSEENIKRLVEFWHRVVKERKR